MKVRKILALALSLLMIMATIPATTFAATAADITLYPDNGKTFYAGSTMDFVATISNAASVTFALDGKDMGTPVADGTKYTLKYDVTALANGYHTFTVNATIGGQEVTKSSTFDFYGYEKVLMYNDFEGITSTSSVELSNADNIIPGVVTFSVGNGASVAKTEGAGGVGSALKITSATSSGYPSFNINLTKVPFAGGALGSASGHTNGIFKTEFDLKVNTITYVAALGVGSSNSSATAGGTFPPIVCMNDGRVTNNSQTKHDGTWKHYEMIVDYNNNCFTTLVDGVVSYSTIATSEIFPFGIKSNTGITFQTYSGSKATDFEIDNLKITHSTAIEMGTINFNGMGSNVKQYDGYSYPRGYIVADNVGTSTFDYMEGPGGAGDRALKFLPKGSDFTNIRHYMQNKRYGIGITDGIIRFAVDLYPTKNFAYQFGSGFGWGGDFAWSGSCGSQPIVLNKWNHIEYIADLTADTSRVYVNGVLARTDIVPSGTILDFEQKFQFLIRGATNNTDGYVGFDNWSVTYINQPKVTQVSAKNAQGSFAAVTDGVVSYETTSFKLGLSKAYVSIGADDVSVTANGKEIGISALSANGTELTVDLAKEIGSGKNVEIIVKDTAVVGTSTSNGALDSVSTQARDAVVKLKSTENPALKPWKQYAPKTILENDFESFYGIEENKTTTNARPYSSVGYQISTWTVNDGMMMQKVTGAGGEGSALRFYSNSTTTGLHAAHLSLNEYLWGATDFTVGLNEQQAAVAKNGRTSGLFVTEFDIKLDIQNSTVAMLGFGITPYGGNYNQTTDSWFIQSSNKVGSKAFEKGEWARLTILSDMREEQCVVLYNGAPVMKVAAPYGYGLYDVFGRKGIAFQAYGSGVDFTIDNFKVTEFPEEVYNLGSIDFEGIEDGANAGDIMKSVEPGINWSYTEVGYSNGLTASLVKAVEGPDGAGDTAFSFAPTKEHSGLRIYHKGFKFEDTRLGTMCVSMDVKFTGTNLALGLASGVGEAFGTNQISSGTYNDGKWHHLDLVSDLANNVRTLYIDGDKVSESVVSSPLLSSSVDGDDSLRFLEFQVRGYSASHPESSVAVDNLSYHYIARPGFGYFTVTENATNKTATAKMDSWFTDSAKYHEVIVASYITSDDGSLELDKVTLVPCDGAVGTINKTSATINEISDNKTVIKAFLWGEDQTPIEMIVK